MQIKKMEETVQGLELKMKEKDFKNKNLQEKVTYCIENLLVCLFICPYSFNMEYENESQTQRPS